MKPTHPLVQIIRLSRPLLLAGGIGQYIFGVGMAKYTGALINPEIFWTGLLWVIAMLLSGIYLYAYFSPYVDRRKWREPIFTDHPEVLGDGEGMLPRFSALVAASGTLSSAGLISMQWNLAGLMQPKLVALMLLITFVTLFYSMPPLRLSFSGIGEFSLAVFIGGLIPLMSFTLHGGMQGFLVEFSAFPLIFLLAAAILTLEIPNFSSDMKFELLSLPARIGWENAMGIHNASIFLAFVSLAAAGFLGLSWDVCGSAMILLPLGVIQIGLMRAISQGAKPHWNLVIFNGFAVFSLMSYIMTYIYWTA